MYEDYREKREDNKQQQMLKDLKLFAVKRLQTTMIGDLSCLEENLGFLWKEESENQDYYYDIFQKIRSTILDRGNDQIRKLENKFISLTDDNRHIVSFTMKKEER